MNHEHYSGEQIRFLRRLPRTEPMHVPYNADPVESFSDLAVGAACFVIALLAVAGVIG
mgnify:CR=1 FL=1